MLDPHRQAAAVFIGRSVGDGFRIEDDHVGSQVLAEQTAVLQSEAAGGVSGQVLHRLLERPGAGLADMMTQVTGEAAPAARVRTTADEDAVAAGHHRRMPDQLLYVLLAAALDDPFKVEGGISANGENAKGVWIESTVADRVWNTGTISVSGQETGIKYDTDDARPSALAAFGIGASLARGFQIPFLCSGYH